MKKTLRYNYRLNPTPEQEAKLIEFGATARGIWNLLLSENMCRYAHHKTFLFYKDMARLIKELKSFDEFAWIKAFDSAAAQQVARDLETALKNSQSRPQNYFRLYITLHSLKNINSENHICKKPGQWENHNDKEPVKHAKVVVCTNRYYSGLNL
jgi:transposase